MFANDTNKLLKTGKKDLTRNLKLVKKLKCVKVFLKI